MEDCFSSLYPFFCSSLGMGDCFSSLYPFHFCSLGIQTCFSSLYPFSFNILGMKKCFSHSVPICLKFFGYVNSFFLPVPILSFSSPPSVFRHLHAASAHCYLYGAAAVGPVNGGSHIVKSLQGFFVGMPIGVALAAGDNRNCRTALPQKFFFGRIFRTMVRHFQNRDTGNGI